MESGQRKSSGCVIEGRRGPVGGGVALLAILREARRRVGRVIRVVEVGLVTVDAGCIRRSQIVIAVHVTLRALQRGVETGQRESGGRVIEARAAPIRGVVALLASLREV